MRGGRAFSPSRDGAARPARAQRSPQPASPVLPRPGPRGGLTITTRDSLWTEGSPQPPPQQLSSKGAAILPGPTSVTRKYSCRPLSSTWSGGGGTRSGGGLLLALDGGRKDSTRLWKKINHTRS